MKNLAHYLFISPSSLAILPNNPDKAKNKEYSEKRRKDPTHKANEKNTCKEGEYVLSCLFAFPHCLINVPSQQIENNGLYGIK